MCRLFSFGSSSAQTGLCGDYPVVEGLYCREAVVVMYLCQNGCIILVCVVVSFRSLRFSWSAGSVSVAFRIDSVVSRLVAGCILSPQCSLA